MHIFTCSISLFKGLKARLASPTCPQWEPKWCTALSIKSLLAKEASGFADTCLPLTILNCCTIRSTGYSNSCEAEPLATSCCLILQRGGVSARETDRAADLDMYLDTPDTYPDTPKNGVENWIRQIRIWIRIWRIQIRIFYLLWSIPVLSYSEVAIDYETHLQTMICKLKVKDRFGKCVSARITYW